jgi:(+)-trans-carveol dehydrogenase
MGRLEGKVALITGAARGQGRSHAVRLAEEGADIIAVDICRQIDSMPVPMARPEDLAETVHLVEGLDRRIVASEADVRDLKALTAAVDEGVAELGHLDIVVANAGITAFGPSWEMDESSWRDTIDVDLTGVWHTTRAATPHVVQGGRGGAMVLTSSAAGEISYPFMASYVTAKHAVIGLARSLALELAEHSIRVNTVLPTTVNSPMVRVEMFDEKAVRDVQAMNALPVPWVETVDISNAILFLVSDEARYVTGVSLPVDAGLIAKSGSLEHIEAMWSVFGGMMSGAPDEDAWAAETAPDAERSQS